eukprot:20366-Heterococcus_DN1.PRE.1
MKKAAAGSAPKSAAAAAAVAAAAAACDAAFVYVCCKCAHIIGDSESLVHAEGVEEAVTLRCATNVMLAGQLQLCTENSSTYRSIHCKHCQVELGRTYLSTPPKLDAVRGLFALHMSCIERHEIGSGMSVEQLLAEQ